MKGFSQLETKCIQFHTFGRPQDVLKINYKNIESLERNEVLVRMLARPINPSDIRAVTGDYAHRITLPNIPGYEGVSIITDVGCSVSKQLIGQRVLPLRGEGTWQEYVKTSVDFVVPIPDSIDDCTAAQMYINPITACVICTETLKLTSNDVLLVNVSGSAIGRIIAQLSHIIGFQFIAITRNHRHTEELLRLGASHVIDTATDSLYEKVMALTEGKGATAAIDSIGGQAGNELAFAVRPNGHFLTIGLLSGIQVNWELITNQAKVHANIFHLRHWNQAVSVEKWQSAFKQIISLIEYNDLQLMERNASFPLENINDAIDALEASKKGKGKIFLTS